MTRPLLSLAIGALALGVAGGARADTSLNADLPIWSFASYDLAGNAIANQISYSYPFATPTADNGEIPYWTAMTTFAQPAAGEVLNLVNIRPDDRTVILLNGVVVAAYGGLGPGLSTFVFTPGGPELPQFFENSCCEGGALNAIIAGGFVSGANTLQFIVNNTNQGIYGPLVDFGPSRLSFEGYIGAPRSAEPEPSTWAMLLLGFLGLGSVLRQRPTASP